MVGFSPKDEDFACVLFHWQNTDVISAVNVQLQITCGSRFALKQLFHPLLGPSKMVSGGHCYSSQQNLLSFLDQLQIGYWNGEVWDVPSLRTIASFASNFGVVPV